MKIYFVDGYLDKYLAEDIPGKHTAINAGFGLTECKKYLDLFCDSDYDFVVTNSSLALDNKYVWNEELGVPELYLCPCGQWVRVDNLTNRNLTQGHNLFKLYMAGEFGQEYHAFCNLPYTSSY